MTHYFLDSCVATHILDGDLWRRKPQKLPIYRTELRFSQYRLHQMPEKEGCVKLALQALEWAEDTSSEEIKLWITPTVKTELMCAPQVRPHLYSSSLLFVHVCVCACVCVCVCVRVCVRACVL